jgi:hypothetical protein
LHLQITLLITGTALVAIATGLFFAGVHKTILSPIKTELFDTRPTGSNSSSRGEASDASDGSSNGQPTAAIVDNGQSGTWIGGPGIEHVNETGGMIVAETKREATSGPEGHAVHITAAAGNAPSMSNPSPPLSLIPNTRSAGENSDSLASPRASIFVDTATVCVAPDGTYTVQGHFFSITGLLNDPNEALQDKP